MNSINLIGRIATDLKLQERGENTVLNFTLAVFRTKDHTDFLPISAWNKTAELIFSNTEKGRLLGISGDLRSKNYTEGENKKVSYTVNVDTVDFCEWQKQE